MTIPGIQAIGIAVPEYTLPLVSLAEVRGHEPGRYIEDYDSIRMSVAGPDEDAVTLAVSAARQAFALGNIDASSIGLLVVGTQSPVDRAKPVAAYVHGLLGLPWSCRTFDTQHAGFAATAGLQSALDWVRAGSSRGRKALVIGSDVVRHPFGSAVEPLQGSAAVALVVSEESPLVTFEDAIVGSFTRDVYDAWQPLDSECIVTDAERARDCYLQALAGAFREYQRSVREVRGGSARSSDLAGIVYHAPYPKLAYFAHQHLRSYESENSTSSRDLARLRSEEDASLSFRERVEPALVLARQVGNAGAASVYLGLASALLMSDGELEGAKLGLFSYGAGSCAEFFEGTVCEWAQGYARRAGWGEMLDAQRIIDVTEYERLLRGREEYAKRRELSAPREGRPTFLGVSAGARRYR